MAIIRKKDDLTMLKLEENETRSRIDEAIDKAMKMKADAMKKIEDILDTFIADKIIFYLLEDSLDVTVYGVDLDGEGVVLNVYLGDEVIADLKYEDFPDEVTCIDVWIDYLKVAVQSLNSRTERIEVGFIRENDDELDSCDFSIALNNC